MFSLELPHGEDSNEYTQHTIFNIKKRNTPKIIPNLHLRDFFLGNEEQILNSHGERVISV